ncbi:YT521-B-like domain-containing protein [Phaeosphaeria sp. MPI-PUGE-AT-0046c]|nr:YT521-B-like domain-containing protein [Phaeosphaeria sp. MPI-PUGE-AT-0046c]
MAFFWVQQWVALPVIYEGPPMGDLPPGSRPQASDSAATGLARDGNPSLSSPGSSPYKYPDNGTPFYSQLNALPQHQLRPDFRSPTHATPQHSSQDHGASSMNMATMAGALPEYGSIDSTTAMPQGTQSIPRSLFGASTSAVAYQLGQNLQMPAQTPVSMSGHQHYNNMYATGPYQQQAFVQGAQHTAYPPFPAGQSRMPTNYSMPPQYMYYPTPYGHQGQYNAGYSSQTAPNQAMYDRRGSMTGTSVGLNPPNMEFQHHDNAFTGPRVGGAEQAAMGPGFGPQFSRMQGMPQTAPTSSIPRGPPRKPKQSGHALWVGNLPPGTTVVALKDHFSREATKDIESLFLISKSNCAFVNYRSEASCTAAMHRFHDSRFNGVRLVCRLRRTSAPASGVPSGPSAMLASQQANAPQPVTPKVENKPVTVQEDTVSEFASNVDTQEATEASTSTSKYFIVKSLTLQDLELSVRNGIWATQSHNEDVLNKAFRSTENVYLIFSANKSGEYFGYARMKSHILEDSSALIGSVPKPDNIMEIADVPKSIPTPATEWAPKGKIIDDSARGTIFWEAELSEAELEDETSEKEDIQVDADPPAVAQSWGKPFKIEWLSTNRLPFYRTRGLRNPWNANREVKIARDGTELEPSVGDRLVQMFHRLGPSNAGGPPLMAPHAQLGGPVIPQMRPHPF